MVDQSRIKFNFITLTILWSIIQFGSGDYVSRHPRDLTGHFHGEAHHHHSHGAENVHPLETVGLVPPEALFPKNGDVAPHCQCVVRNTGCLGREAFTRLFDGISTLQCGESFERCCFEDPWPGLVDRDGHILPCVPQEQCARYYGQEPTDVRDFGTLSPCPGAGAVRCIPPNRVVVVGHELVVPPPQPDTIIIPIVEIQRDTTPPPVIPETTPPPPVIPETTPPPPVIPETTPPPPTIPTTPSTPLPPTYNIPPPPPEYEAPKPVQTYEAPKIVETYEAPKPVQTYEAPKIVETYEAPKPVPTYEAPKIVETYEAPKPVPTYEAPKIVETYEAPVAPAVPPFRRPGPPYLWRNLNGFYPTGGIGYPYGYGFNFHKRIGFGIGGGFF